MEKVKEFISTRKPHVIAVTAQNRSVFPVILFLDKLTLNCVVSVRCFSDPYNCMPDYSGYQEFLELKAILFLVSLEFQPRGN